MALEATYKRRFFMRAAMALVRADGTFSPAERKAMGGFADVFGLSNERFGEIEQSAGPWNKPATPLCTSPGTPHKKRATPWAS